MGHVQQISASITATDGQRRMCDRPGEGKSMCVQRPEVAMELDQLRADAEPGNHAREQPSHRHMLLGKSPQPQCLNLLKGHGHGARLGELAGTPQAIPPAARSRRWTEPDAAAWSSMFPTL